MSFVNPTPWYAFMWISITFFYRIWKDFQLNLFVALWSAICQPNPICLEFQLDFVRNFIEFFEKSSILFVALTIVTCQPSPTPLMPLYEFQLDFLRICIGVLEIVKWICGSDRCHLSTQPNPPICLNEFQLDFFGFFL